MKKRLLSAVLGCILAFTLVGGGTMAALQFMERQQQGVVFIGTAEIGLYTDAACTIPLEEGVAIDFGIISFAGGQCNNPKVVYAKNEGDVPAYMAAAFETTTTGLTGWIYNTMEHQLPAPPSNISITEGVSLAPDAVLNFSLYVKNDGTMGFGECTDILFTLYGDTDPF